MCSKRFSSIILQVEGVAEILWPIAAGKRGCLNSLSDKYSQREGAAREDGPKHRARQQQPYSPAKNENCLASRLPKTTALVPFKLFG